jgi:hypothetical protein
MCAMCRLLCLLWIEKPDGGYTEEELQRIAGGGGIVRSGMRQLLSRARAVATRAVNAGTATARRLRKKKSLPAQLTPQLIAENAAKQQLIPHTTSTVDTNNNNNSGKAITLAEATPSTAAETKTRVVTAGGSDTETDTDTKASSIVATKPKTAV